MLGFSLLGLAFIIWLPQHIIPNSNSSKYDEILRVATTRNSIRSTIAQIVAGLAFVATFVQGSVNFSADYKQKSDLATADQFAKAFSQLKDTPGDTWAMIGNFYILANIAESDIRYHEPVYGALSQFIVQHSRLTCGTGSAEDAGATQRDVYRQTGYSIAPVLQTAIRLFVDRTKDKQTQRQFHLEGACLANADLYGAEGLSWILLSGAKLLRVSAVNSKFEFSDLRGIETGVEHNSNWNDEYKGIGAWRLHHGVAPDMLAKIRANFEGAEFQTVKLNGSGFEGANLKSVRFLDSNLSGVNFDLSDLTGATFSGSDLTGAHMNGANIATADFSTAKNLSVEQLLAACMRVDAESTVLKSNWPKLPDGLAAKVETAGGFKLCS